MNGTVPERRGNQEDGDPDHWKHALDLLFDILTEGSDHTVWGQDGNCISRLVFCLKLSGEGIWFDLLGLRIIGQGKIEPCENRAHLACLALSPSPTDVLQVLMVSPHQGWLLNSLQPATTPMLLYCQKLLVALIKNAFGVRELQDK